MPEATASCASCATSNRSASIASTELCGVLNVDKPTDWTSHDVVARIRRLACQKRVGHAGTLDPMATGVLPVLLGRATRLADFIQQGHKTYLATMALGAATDTDDAEGTVVGCAPVPPLSEAEIRDALQRFEGNILQTPPRYSAIKVGGKRAYAVARGGGALDLAPRAVCIYSLSLVEWSPGQLDFEVTCSRGTYVRALARDIAAALGTLGHLSALRRTAVGPFGIATSVTLDEIAERGVANVLLTPATALPDLPTFSATESEVQRLNNGQGIPAALRAACVWVYDRSDRLVCLASADGSLLRPRFAL